MSKPSAKIILDSASSEHGHRLTTFEVKLHRFVLAELNTHRAFSRNSASSRAIPIKKQIDRVLEDPAYPLHWGANKPGMQADAELDDDDTYWAKYRWDEARYAAVQAVQALDELGLHKQVANRLLEPFLWHTVIITATEAGLENFFHQRCTVYSPLAQPEMRAAADAMFTAYRTSRPLPPRYLWHMPYITEEDVLWAQGEESPDDWPITLLQRLSVARCARVSYLTHDGVRDPKIDLDLYDKLVSAKPMHASPLEHVATPVSLPLQQSPGNFDGWHQLRHIVENSQASQAARKDQQ